jgi:hypothetical protein
VIARAIDCCDLELPTGAMNARVLTDPRLCASAVVVRVNGIAHAGRVDEAARWLLDACLVEELVSASADPTVPRL